MTIEYPWYDAINGKEELMQGDFIEECPLIIPPLEIPTEVNEVEARINKYNVVVMSQSCDIVYKKLEFILVCPIWPLSNFENSLLKSPKVSKEDLRKGNISGYHLLNKCKIDGFKKDYSVVDFRSTHSVDFNFLVNLAQRKTKRLRLLPPYREHLSQAFARFFMRVGLPIDIPSF